jgi:uncharacterized protein
MVRVNVASLTRAKVGQQKTVEIDKEEQVIDDLHLQYLRGTLQFTRVSDGILTEGALQTAVKVACSRCLKDFFQPLTLTFEDVINLPSDQTSPERPLRVSEDGWVDLSPLIREYAWLGIPLNPVCKAECQGLCDQCGGDIVAGECTCPDEDPIDPRWEALRSLLDE